MYYYLDTEFNGFGGDLISLALVRQDGKSVYLVRPRHYNMMLEPWVRENVVPLIYDCPEKPLEPEMSEWGHVIGGFLAGDEKPQIISDWPDDIRYLCQVLIVGPGQMVKTAAQVHFTVARVGAYPTTLEGAVQHNAWWDAMALREFISG